MVSYRVGEPTSSIRWDAIDGNSPVSVTTPTSSYQYTLANSWDKILIEARVQESSSENNYSVKLYVNGDNTNSNYYWRAEDGTRTEESNDWTSIGRISGDLVLDVEVRIKAEPTQHMLRNLSGGGIETSNMISYGRKANASVPINTFTLESSAGTAPKFTIDPLIVYGKNY